VSRSALSLLEVVVAMGLAVMALALMVQLLVPSARISLRGAARTEIQETCVVALRQLAADLQRTNASAFTYKNSSGPTTLGFVALQPLQVDSPEVAPRYLLELVDYIFDPGTGTLRRQRWEPVPSTLVALSAVEGTRLTDSQLNLLLTLTPPLDQRVVAHDVVEFSVGGNVPPPNMPNPVNLHLVVQKKTTSMDPDRFRLDQTVTIRNAP